ncbi:MAG: selenium-dependent xanthine dehydrogenase [Gemmatimonadetes bacterium]|nr:selenium-dependent xanthine dehydrogenase [Gemmatimonadota bacterium]
MTQISFQLNGEDVRVETRSGESLMHTLRVRCGIRSIKNGCDGQGQCGACLALVGGRPRTTCATPAEKAEGKEIVTLEGVSAEDRERVANAFVAAGAVQCGFCTPGLALRAIGLLGRRDDLTRDEIARAIDGHLCRCTGYRKVVDAISMLQRARRGEAVPRIEEGGGVGRDLGRLDGVRSVLGERAFVGDMEREGLLHGALRLAPCARARVVGIDTARARALPGVVAIATADDVPSQRWLGLIEQDWPVFVAVGEELRCVGDVLAVVTASDEATARAAARLIDVDHEPLPPLVDPLAALGGEAHRVNPRHENLLHRTSIVRGDVDAALAQSRYTVSDTWTTQRIEHLFLEPESALAEPLDDGRLRVYSQGQGVYDDRRQLARFLGVAEESVLVELVAPGGAFGGKEDLSVQAHAALLATMTGRPVRVTLSREESIRLHPKRHPIRARFALGCDEEGNLTGLRASIVGDSGAYASVGAKVLERAAGHACGSYKVPNVEIEARAVYTNNPPSGAMRGFGVNQVNFAIEGCIDRLAEQVGIDGWAMRMRNAVEIGDTITTGQVLRESVGLKQTLLAVKPHFEEARERGRAVGIACGIKNCGIGNGEREWGKAELEVESDGSVTISSGYSEMGQGLFTVLAQCAVEATGLPASVFRAKTDTIRELDCGLTTGSRATLLGGRAVESAALKLLADLDRGHTLDDLAGRGYRSKVVIDDTVPTADQGGDARIHIAYGFATQLCVLDDEGRVERIVAAHDVGRAINPLLCEGQIEGSIHMGLGAALTEELPCEKGVPISFDLRELGVLRARDMPEIEVILIEDRHPEGPYGAKGVGEIGLVPTASAVAGALAAFDGRWRTALPMTESAAARAMSVGRKPRERERS